MRIGFRGLARRDRRRSRRIRRARRSLAFRDAFGDESVERVLGPTTPAGEVAIAVHVGGYDRLHAAHDAIHAWRAREGRTFAGTSWEVYGDWSDDPSQLETTVCYLLE